MSKQELPEDEAQRMASLHATQLLFTPPEERFDRITRIASRLLDTPIALVSLVADDCQWFKSVHGLTVSETPRENSFCSYVVLEEKTFVVENAELDPRFSDNRFVTGAPGIRFYAGHPLRTADGSRVGTFSVIDKRPRQFTFEQFEILRDLAALAETELQRGHLSEIQSALTQERDELKRKASIDALTRAWSRSAILELLSVELVHSTGASSLCVAMIDVDHFKKVNDTLGHQAGDSVLVEIAARIRRAVRETDAVGRYGGEEFIAVLSNCNLDAAKMVCEKVRRSIVDAPIVTDAGEINASVSIGLAAIDPAHDFIEHIIGAADVALYRAKNSGRNRLEF